VSDPAREWVPYEAVLAIHEAQISEHGGIRGIRDKGLIESALVKPQNLQAYGTPDAAALAASYAYGLSRNHGFLDGNKRSGFAVAATFLDVNGYAVTAADEAIVEAMLAVASGVMAEEKLATWFRSNIVMFDEFLPE
jgi:death-on-curing protein